MNAKRRGVRSLPLGVDANETTVSIVAAVTANGAFEIRETRTLDVRPVAGDGIDRAIAETIRLVVAGLTTKERRCVLAAAAGDAATRVFRVPPKMRRREAERAAELEADAIVDWAPSERLVALDSIPGRADEMLLSVARNGAIERIVAIARAGGLSTIAVDTTGCAWRRALPGIDAVLDCSRERATLEVFGDPVGITRAFPPRLIDERLASGVRSSLMDARRDGIADAARLAILAPPFRFESLAELLHDDGYGISGVSLGDVESPSWSLAYGLATWSVARRGLHEPR